MKVSVYKCASTLKWAIDVNGLFDGAYYRTRKGALIAARRKYPNANHSQSEH